MTEISKIDDVLKWFVTSPFSLGNPNFLDIDKGLKRDYPEITKDIDWYSELGRILDKLVIDGFISSWEHDFQYFEKIGSPPIQKRERVYTKTLLGELHYKEGGYTAANIKRANIELAEKQLAIEKTNEIARNKRTYWLTFVIAFGTGIAAFYYFLEILRIQYHLGLPNHINF